MAMSMQRGPAGGNRWGPASLATIILAYTILVAIYSWQTPPFEGPDEPQHFAYAAWLAAGKGLPPLGAAAWDTPMEQEAGQTPLYYLLAAVPLGLAGGEASTAVYQPNPYFPGPAIDNVFDNNNRALHFAADLRAGSNGWPDLYLARLVTLSFGIALIIGVYALAKQVWPTQPAMATSAAFLVAFTPQVLFLSGVVSNDIPAAAVSTLALVALAVLIRRAPVPAWNWALAVGLLVGLAGMVKINALLLVVPAAAALLWLRLGAKEPITRVAGSALLMTLGALLVSGWWFWRTAQIEGSLLGIDTHNYAPWVVANPGNMAGPIERWLEVGRYYWITLGWGTIRPPGWIYAVLLIFALLAAVGLVLAAQRRWQGNRLALNPTVAILLVLITMILANAILLEVWMNRVIAPYGRLLFPSIAALTILLILGWQAIHRRFVLLPLLFLGVLAILAPFFLLKPAFTPPLLSPQAIDQLPPSLGWRFGSGPDGPLVELVSVEPARRSVASNDTLAVHLCWRALTQTINEHAFLLQIIGPENQRLADRRSYPGDGLLPTSQWPPGDVFCDTMHIRLQAESAPTLVYQLEIGVLEEETGKRLAAVDREGQDLAATFVDQIRVASAASSTALSTEQAAGEPIRLIDFELEPGPWQPQGTYDFALDWSAMMPLTGDYQLFVHLRDSASNAIVAQADRSPLDGWYPTSWWPVGEIIHDEGRITLPASVPAGSYDLVVGFYDLGSLQPIGEEYYLERIEVER